MRSVFTVICARLIYISFGLYRASVDVAALSTPQSDESLNYQTQKDSSRPTNVNESLEQRCTYSLQHAIQALEHIIDK